MNAQITIKVHNITEANFFIKMKLYSHFYKNEII